MQGHSTLAMKITQLTRPERNKLYTDITRVGDKWLPKQSTDCTYRNLYKDTPGAYNTACDNALHGWQHMVNKLGWYLPWSHAERHNVNGREMHPQKCIKLWDELHSRFAAAPDNVDKSDKGYSDTPPAPITLSAWYFVECPYLTGENKIVELTFKIFYIENETRYGKFWDKKCTGQITIDKVPTREPLSLYPVSTGWYQRVAEFIRHSKVANKLAEAWPPPYKYV